VHGIERIVPIGPAGQAALTPLLLDRWPAAFVFSPQRAEDERHAELRRRAMERYRGGSRPNAKRDADRRANPNPVLSDRYDTSSYRQAIEHACRAAGVPSFGPNRLRHTALTEARRRAGIDAAQVLGGHTDIKTTQRSASASSSRASARNVPSRSRGPSISTGPWSVFRVFLLVPFREFKALYPSAACFS
jgi:integrase